MNYVTPPTCNCKDCGTPLQFYFQPTWGKAAAPDTLNGEPGAMMATCFNRDCDMFGVTRWIEDLNNLTEAQRDEYRQMNRDSRARREAEAVLS